FAAEGVEIGALQGLGQGFAKYGVGDGHGGGLLGGGNRGAEGSTDPSRALATFALAFGGRLATKGATLAGSPSRRSSSCPSPPSPSPPLASYPDRATSAAASSFWTWR